MFNVIMRPYEWGEGTNSMPLDRMFEDTEGVIAARFKDRDVPALDRLSALPCLFIPEGRASEICRVGRITRARIFNREVVFDYVVDPDIPAFTNGQLFAKKRFLDMNTTRNDWYWQHNHWAVKDVDLFRVLLSVARPQRQRPVVFQIPESETIDGSLVSAMMPFDAGFAGVYGAIQLAAANLGMRCLRADDIWEHHAIIQDVVALIDRSRIVVCDCTGRNPNVFYEAGIAHALGRDVILITRSEHDIPFDLRHIRYVQYLNNAEGLAALGSALQQRIQTLRGGQ